MARVPMRAERIPAWMASWPRVGPMARISATLRGTGREPERRTRAISLASSTLESPSMTAWPPVMAWRITGAV